MRLLRIVAFLSIALPAAVQPLSAQASASHQEAVKRLLVVSRVRELTLESADAMLNSQMQQMPQLAHFKTILQEFNKEQLDWAVLEPEFTRIYLEVFTEAEVKDLVKLYESPVGKMMLEKMPQLMGKTSDFTTKRMQAGMPVLMQRLQAAMQGQVRSDTSSLRR